jgi:hypothetical protein
MTAYRVDGETVDMLSTSFRSSVISVTR